MFSRDLFVYNEETHEGTYQGQRVPSVTQLVGILFPLSEDIPQDRLENAASHGTLVHDAIAQLNEYFDPHFPYETNLDVVIDVATKIAQTKDLPELIDYVCMLSAFKLKPYEYEQLVFLCDEEGELICYGHFDCVFEPQDDIEPFTTGELTMCDYKTTSTFEKPKVALQESIYALAYEQMTKRVIGNMIGMHLKNGAKIIPLSRHDDKYIIELCKGLAKTWKEQLC